MDFQFSPDEQAFAEEVRGFLRAHPPEGFAIDGMDAGYGSGAHSRDFLRALADRGWLTMSWPRSFGGQERSLMYTLVLFEELAAVGAPFGPLAGCNQTAEGIIRYGSETLRREVLPRIGRGEVTFWQGFSEPEAGSDLLSLRTEAVRRGDEYVIRGHKIWSSHAGIADYGLVLARTDPSARRHKGLSMFVVDNATAGMDIRPITSLTGEVYHYEVFLDDVRVPAGYLLGQEGEGFTQLLRGLDTDRFWGRFYKAPMLRRVLGELVQYANVTSRNGVLLALDRGLRRRLATLATDVQAARLLFYRIAWMIREGRPTPYETALVKVMADETGQAVAALGMEMLGLHGPLTGDSRWARLRGAIQHLYQTSLGQTIAGGTSEVLRSTVATRGLGLPTEARPRD
ncbi:MAG TPA: acyl-CoA dehydrogenase family protein [Candidatus Bathyarchaeia archaeon]|nr:acyl-CoA dehydrogenase family protein [Candidatus Bathyarchaeia archaeon]